jgi:uncharacterized protein
LDIELSPYEARVIGCLIEKAITTPEQYPLSLSALTAACNQKSNREPVLELEEATVQETVDGLVRKGLVSERTGFGSRVAKYQQRFCNTEFSSLRLSDRELGIVCLLLLRGPQTPGELRTRTQRLCTFADVQEVESTLQGMMEREEGPLVARLPRAPGRRESRYAHLFSGSVEALEGAETGAAAGRAAASDPDTIEKLEQEVSALRQELEALKRKIEPLL